MKEDTEVNLTNHSNYTLHYRTTLATIKAEAQLSSISRAYNIRRVDSGDFKIIIFYFHFWYFLFLLRPISNLKALNAIFVFFAVSAFFIYT